jgi:hypothetical protein
MNAAEILFAVQKAGAALRVEGDSLVASNASRLVPAIKAAIREHKPHLIAALVGSGCAVEIVELPQTGRYRKTFAFLQLKPPGPGPGRALAALRQGRKPVPRGMGRAGRVVGLDVG